MRFQFTDARDECRHRQSLATRRFQRGHVGTQFTVRFPDVAPDALQLRLGIAGGGECFDRFADQAGQVRRVVARAHEHVEYRLVQPIRVDALDRAGVGSLGRARTRVVADGAGRPVVLPRRHADLLAGLGLTAATEHTPAQIVRIVVHALICGNAIAEVAPLTAGRGGVGFALCEDVLYGIPELLRHDGFVRRRVHFVAPGRDAAVRLVCQQKPDRSHVPPAFRFHFLQVPLHLAQVFRIAHRLERADHDQTLVRVRNTPTGGGLDRAVRQNGVAHTGHGFGHVAVDTPTTEAIPLGEHLGLLRLRGVADGIAVDTVGENLDALGRATRRVLGERFLYHLDAYLLLLEQVLRRVKGIAAGKAAHVSDDDDVEAACLRIRKQPLPIGTVQVRACAPFVRILPDELPAAVIRDQTLGVFPVDGTLGVNGREVARGLVVGGAAAI